MLSSGEKLSTLRDPRLPCASRQNVTAHVGWMSIFDPVALILIIGVFTIAHLIFSIHPFRFAEALVQEFKHFFAREKTTGAANAVGIRASLQSGC
jgi:hypothetical protein